MTFSFSLKAGHAKELSALPQSGGRCGCGGVGEQVDSRKLRKASRRERSKPIERAAQITLEHTPRMNMNDKPNLVATFYQNAGAIHRSERENVNGAKCLKIAARTLRSVDKTRAAILYLDCCNLLLPSTKPQELLPPQHSADDFTEALGFLLEINAGTGTTEPNKWLPEAIGLLQRLCIILDIQNKNEELHKWYLGHIIILLTLLDVDLAKETFASQAKNSSYTETPESDIARQIVTAFTNHDDRLLKKVQGDLDGLPDTIKQEEKLVSLVKKLNIFRFPEAGVVAP